jgi:glycolate oxidase FAD binding subunit
LAHDELRDKSRDQTESTSTHSIPAPSSGNHHTGDLHIQQLVRDAVASRHALRIVGRGTWLDAGHPVHATRTISVADDTGVIAYVPGDLTITVRAGTTLADIEEALRPHGQWLPLDPLGGREGTIGATVATCAYGPLAALFGTPRDHVLGLTVVTGTGDIIHVGGRVVKNVAGFDLTRLMIGAWGTLGVITQVTLRVRGQSRGTANLEHLRHALPSAYGTRAPAMPVPRLSQALKHTFDPHHTLNPGILGDAQS